MLYLKQDKVSMLYKKIILCLIGSLFFSCVQKHKAEITPPISTTDDWEVSTPEKEGFKNSKLQETIADFVKDNPKLDGIVVVKNGKLIAETYANGYTIDSLHKIWSITKHITGTLIGIATDKGLLAETDSIYKYLNDYNFDTLSLAKGITIEHLLTMTSGFEWKELGGPKSSGFQLPYSNNWINFVLRQPHKYTPGAVFNYSTGNTLLLAPILKKATHKQASDFAIESLFAPLKITHYEWDTQSEFWSKTQGGELGGAKIPDKIIYDEPFAQLTNTGSGLRMRPRDLCKIGQLYLDSGMWKGTQIVSKQWVNASTRPHFGNTEYGYHWRLATINGYTCFYATGFGVQRIFVVPQANLVVVTTQHNYQTMPQGNKLTEELMANILDAIITNK